MIVEHRLFFIYLLFCSSRFAIAQPSGNRNASIWNFIPGVTTLLINGPSREVILDTVIYYFPPILEGNGNPPFFCGFSCNNNATECIFGVFLGIYHKYSTGDIDTQLVWSANRDHPVKTNATLQLGQDGNLVLADSDGTLVWSTNTTGKSVSGLILMDMGNLVLFDSTNSTIWQSFDHPTDCLLPGQSLVSGRKLIASASATNQSQGLFGLTILNGNWGTYINSDPPQFYYASSYQDNSTYFSFDGQTLTALQGPSTLPTQFMKLEHDGHLRVYQWRDNYWEEESDVLTGFTTNCGYPMVCGRYSICTNDSQCLCPVEGNLFRPFTERKPNLGCTELTPISCNSLHHSLIELKNTTYFAFHSNLLQLNSSIYLENTNLEECKRACLSNCSCKAVVWSGELLIKNCLLLNEIFSIMDNAIEWYDYYSGTSFFLKVQEHLPIKNSRHFTVIIGSTLAAFFGIPLSIAACFVLFRKSTYESKKAGDFLDLEPILPGILTRFSYSDLKIITQDFSRKLGEGGFGSVYEGTLSNGNKIAVKRLNGLGQVKDSFLTEVKIVGSIHHVNLVKLIGFCAEKDYRVLIYEYMVNGSLDKWISHENQENGLTWFTRQRIISDIAKGLAYLHDECNQKIIHLDIKPHNILLDKNFNAKISDFGLSKLIEKDKSKVVTRMRGTPGYLAPEWLRSVITEKVDVYAFGIVLLEVLCGRKNLDSSQADEDNVHLLSVFKRKAEQKQLMDMVDKNNEDMQLHREEVTEMMSLAAWCLQGDFNKRPSMTVVVKVLEGLVSVETNLDFNFTNLTEVGTRNQPMEVPISSILPSVLSGPR